jgi:acetoin utilization protein AcuB
MLVRDWMNPRPLTIGPGATLAEAKSTMERYWIRHLLVVEGNDLLGIFSDRDLRTASLPAGAQFAPAAREARLEQVAVREAMTKDPQTVRPDATLQEVARVMLEHRFGALPVVDTERLVGIITETDILRAFLKLSEGA